MDREVNLMALFFSVPRVLFDGWSIQMYQKLFSSEDHQEDCINAILEFIKVLLYLFFWMVT